MAVRRFSYFRFCSDDKFTKHFVKMKQIIFNSKLCIGKYAARLFIFEKFSLPTRLLIFSKSSSSNEYHETAIRDDSKCNVLADAK